LLKVYLIYGANMSEEIILILTAISIGFVHTVIGPDHYLPFIAIAKARNWKKRMTTIIVILCGIGHVFSSVIIGLIGIAMGIAISSLTSIEAFRGNIAGWLLIAFGLLYTLWGIKKAAQNKKHTHLHFHHDGIIHEHGHNHEDEHAHVHLSEKKPITPWVLFIIFILGPCEPLIPLVMYPAAMHHYSLVIVVSIVFGIVTIGTMLVMTFLGIYGINMLPVNKLEKYMHALAGFAILMCGVTIKFLGL
jgi:nickel/cobalt exporter